MRLDGVGKRYGIRLPWVVRDVCLEIRPGGLVRFEGRNGTGKSTLLRVIAGVSAPSRGAVTGRPVTGYVPERFPPALPFSAHDYLCHIGRLHGMTGGDLSARIQVCLDRLGGREFAAVPLRNMSKGMCQKVAVAQALLPPSGLLVLDEAWTGLDAEAKAALDEVVAERLASGGSVVFVDHDPRRLDHLDAERWRIEDGQVRRVGSPDGGAAVAGRAGQAAAEGADAAAAVATGGAVPDGAVPDGAVPDGDGAGEAGQADEARTAEARTAEARDGAGEHEEALAEEPLGGAGALSGVSPSGVSPSGAPLSGAAESGDVEAAGAPAGTAPAGTVPAEAAPAGAAPAGTAPAGGLAEEIVIEVAGYPAEAEDPGAIAGVAAASVAGDRLIVRAEPGASDAVLRRLLDAGADVHVLEVRAKEGQR